MIATSLEFDGNHHALPLLDRASIPFYYMHLQQVQFFPICISTRNATSFFVSADGNHCNCHYGMSWHRLFSIRVLLMLSTRSVELVKTERRVWYLAALRNAARPWWITDSNERAPHAVTHNIPSGQDTIIYYKSWVVVSLIHPIHQS